jgi:CubicO group peptidase (beta-lactamase class C family)
VKILGRRFLLLKVAALLALAVFMVFLLWMDWAYVGRLRTYPEKARTSVDWYQPMLKVQGVPTPAEIPLSPLGSMPFSKEALSNVVNYSANGNAVALLVLHDGKLVTEWYAPGHGADKFTDSASMMKSITAMLIGIAIGEGKIPSVDTKASLYLPKWKDDRKEISIRNLLQMHAGLRPQGEYDDPFSDACYMALGSDLHYALYRIPLIHPPGTVFDYNNANYQALGFLLEAATGQPFATYLSEKLWKPLGNGDASLWLDHSGGSPRTFGFFFATARDWARVGLMVLNEGRVHGKQVVPAQWLKFMRTPSPTDPTYGAGVYLAPDDTEDPPFLEPTVVFNGHSKQRVYIVPAAKLVMVRVGEQHKRWNDSFLANTLVEDLLKKGQASTEKQ